MAVTGAASTEEEVAWDEDSDSEGSTTPNNAAASSTTTLTKNNAASASTKAEVQDSKGETDTLKPTESRRSHDQQSQAGSDASYDIVSGASSRAPGSPTQEAKVKAVAEESDEEDWE